jgi:thymidylate synthase ThyX
MTTPKATIITEDPIVEVIGEMALNHEGIMNMAKWVERYRPKCLPEGGFNKVLDLLPHDGMEHSDDAIDRVVTDNELLVELAGRNCYHSFAEAGAKRSNGEYIRSMWSGRVPHRSTGYHAKMSFFFAHISRRVSHELIRNYVGSDRDEEGSPSQESTRFTHHPGVYIAHPYILQDTIRPIFLERFTIDAQLNYEAYVDTLASKERAYISNHDGKKPVGLDKKRIYESTAGDLLMSCGTSFVWTTNPMALTKFFHERDDEAADMEMCRFARTLKRVCLARWPNLFPDYIPAKEAAK